MGTESRTFADGRYELFEPIGSGGMATVYRGHDHRLGVARAIKVLLPSYASKPRVRARFEAEARTMAVLDHPNIVRVYDVGANDDTAWIVMELVEGGSLLEKIGKFGLEEQDCLGVTAQVLEALGVAHAHGVVHRDIKPHNVLLSKTGIVRITDFGIARCAGLTEDSFTKTGTVMGTWAFMAPEQRVNAKGVDHTADLYGTGATLFTMCTGQTPMDLFAADLAPDMLKQVPESLIAIIRRATRYNREERYPNAATMLEAVHTVQDSIATQANTVPKPIRSKTTAPVTTQPTPEVLPTVSLIKTEPQEPTNLTYLGEDLPEPAPVLDVTTNAPAIENLSPTSNLTPLPFRPSTAEPPAWEGDDTPQANFGLPKRGTMAGIAIIGMLLVGGAVKRILREPAQPDPNNAVEASTQDNTVEITTEPAVKGPPEPVPQTEALTPKATPANLPTTTKSTPPAPEATPKATDSPVQDVEPQVVQDDHTLPPEFIHAPGGVGRMGGSFPVKVKIAHLHPFQAGAYTVTAYYRAQGSAAYRRVGLKHSGSGWTGTIPIDSQMEEGMEYFVKAKVTSGNDPRLTSFQSGSNSRPHRVRISSP